MTPSRPSKEHPASVVMSVYEKSTPKSLKNVIPWVGLLIVIAGVIKLMLDSTMDPIQLVIIFVVGLFMMMPRGTLKLFEKIPIPKFMQR